MTYTLTKKESKTFDFMLEEDEDATVYSIPVLSKLPLGMLLRAKEYAKEIDDNGDVDVIAFFGFLTDLFEPYAPGVVESLTVEQAALLFKEYQVASATASGEEQLGE